MEKQLVSLLTPHHGMMQLLRDLIQLLRDLIQLLKYQLANWLHSSLLVDCSFADYNQVDRQSVLLASCCIADYNQVDWITVLPASCCFADYNQVDWITVLLIDFYSFLEHIGQHSNPRICELSKNQKTRICNNIKNLKMR